MESARSVEGLDEEVALLRTKLATALREHPDDLDLFLKGIGLLVRAVAIRYRLSGKSEDDLYSNLVATLEGLGAQIFPQQHEEAS